MKRRAGTGGKMKKERRRKTTNPQGRTAPAVARGERPSDIDLQEQLDRRTRELNEALEQQAATSEVESIEPSSSTTTSSTSGTASTSVRRTVATIWPTVAASSRAGRQTEMRRPRSCFWRSRSRTSKSSAQMGTGAACGCGSGCG